MSCMYPAPHMTGTVRDRDQEPRQARQGLQSDPGCLPGTEREGGRERRGGGGGGGGGGGCVFLG
jgi:hypothetical protein